jgi:enediyne biosynthesis protein E4
LPLAKSLGVSPVDLDGDGWIDLIVANDTVQNFVFHNQRNGTFKEEGAASGIAYDPYGTARGAMGIDSGRFQADNTLGVSIGNFANEMTALYVSGQNPLMFSDEAIGQGIGSVSRTALTFGVFFFDYDLDGWLDLLTANGHIEPEINKVFPAQHYEQPAQLFWNARGRGKAGFVLVPREKCGADILKPIVGRGSAFADIDGDGDLDVVLTQVGGAAVLLRNEQKLKHHWLRLKLVGATSNRDGIGAWIRVRAGNNVFSQQVMPTKGYLSQSELPVTFGLGDATRVDEVTITWPGGTKQRVDNLAIDKLNVVKQTP